MKIFINNANSTLWGCVNILRWLGFLVPEELYGFKKMVLMFYSLFWFMFIVGIYIIVQTGDLIQVWGDISLMTNTSFLLFTNLAMATKIFGVMLRRDAVLAIIRNGDAVLISENREEGRAIVKRYPYDTSKSPAYELTYIHQIVAMILLAIVTDSLDLMVTSLTAVCRCRLNLLALSLRTLCHGVSFTDKNILSSEGEKEVQERLRHCVLEHQATLESAAQIQAVFSEPILAQTTVSMVILCVTAYQLAVETDNNTIRIISLWSYLGGMMTQLFLYCYQGNYLSEESLKVADAAYECPWYACPLGIRRSLLIIMVRSGRAAILTAGGFTTLSLDSFVSIIKASYSFFTVLKQMED